MLMFLCTDVARVHFVGHGKCRTVLYLVCPDLVLLCFCILAVIFNLGLQISFERNEMKRSAWSYRARSLYNYMLHVVN